MNPLTDITFFLGAGFSKSWSSSYPTGPELFQITSDERLGLTCLERTARVSGSSSLSALSMDDIKQITYSLDMNAKYPAIRSRYVDECNIPAARAELSTFIFGRLRSLVGNQWHWFDPALWKLPQPPLSSDQKCICGLFASMFDLVDGSECFMQGARFNFLTTNYDWIVESAIDRVCTLDDSVFLYLYRGVSPQRVCGQPNPVLTHEHQLVFNLFKINGGFEVCRDGTGYHLDYLQKKDEQYLVQPPILIFPSREQDYTSPYFAALFPKAVRLLHESRVLVLVGYSVPDEDALLRFLIRHFCEDEADAPRKVLFYIDLASEADQEKRLKSLFPFAGRTLRIVTHCGGFAEWSGEVASLL